MNDPILPVFSLQPFFGLYGLVQCQTLHSQFISDWVGQHQICLIFTLSPFCYLWIAPTTWAKFATLFGLCGLAGCQMLHSQRISCIFDWVGQHFRPQSPQTLTNLILTFSNPRQESGKKISQPKKEKEFLSLNCVYQSKFRIPEKLSYF